MKKILSTLLCLILAAGSYAQHCGSAANVISPLTPTGTPGFTPAYFNMPCIDSGSYVSDTLYYESYATISAFTLDSVRMDSINNLPAGLCWNMNVASNIVRGGQTVAIYITGICNSTVGQYQLKFMGDLYTNGPTFFNQDLGNFPGSSLRYYLRVKNYWDTLCPAVDTSNVNVVFRTHITPSGSPLICHTGGSGTINLQADACAGCSYLWSTGATTAGISVSGTGPYSVTVTNGTDTATAGPVTPIVDAPLTSSFTLAQDTTQVNTWIVTDQSTGTGIRYLAWNWGDGGGYNDSSLIHTYVTQGTYSVCEMVTDSAGCQAYSCDSLGLITIPLPTSPTVTVYGVICNSDSLRITTNYCTGCTYLWSNGDTRQYTYVSSAGPYTVTITLGANSVVATSATIRMVTLASPTFTLTQDTALTNVWHATNTSSIINAYYYFWYWGDGGSDYDSITSVSHQYLNAGNFDVCLEVHDSLGCTVRTCDSTGNVVLPLPAHPSITQTSPICNGAWVYIYTDLCSSCTYRWSTGDSSEYIQATTAGPYTVTITQGANSAISSPFTATVDTIYAHYSLVRDTVNAHRWFLVNECTGSNPLNYHWTWGDGGIDDSSSTPVHTYGSAGYYQICVNVYDNNGCSAAYCDSSTYIYKTEAMIGVVVVPASTYYGLNEINSSTVKVYPNPANGFLTIETVSGGARAATIYDALGRSLRDVNLNTSKTALDVSELPDGVYTLSFRNGASGAVRFVVAR